MKFERIEGAWTALVTPFTATGSVHWEEFERLVAFQVEQGITGLVPTGTTGESPTLTWEEHDRVIETAIKLKGENTKVMAGTGSNSTDEALRGSRHAVEAGADALLLVDCYYNGPSSLELRREYHAVIAKECPGVVVVPYVIPGRSGTALAPEDLAALAEELPNVRAVKEATGDLDRMAHTRQLVGDDFSIMSGDDNITPTIMADQRIRANGVVSVVSNVVPAAVERMTRAFLAGQTEEAQKLARALEPLFGIVTVFAENKRRIRGREVTVRDKFRNPLPIKSLMQALGMITGGCRRPLGRLTRPAVETIRTAARTLWSRNPELLQPIEEHFGVTIEERLENDAFWQPLAYPDA